MREPIYVSKPYLPPAAEYAAMLEKVWASSVLTNNGPLLRELEEKLRDLLGVKHLFIVSNGTIALQIGIRALNLSGEIITSPFSFAASASSILWEHCTPVFADIHPTQFNIDPSRIESLVTARTSAILATHVYGNNCQVDAIRRIADKYELKVVYDAAHSFGSLCNGRSVVTYGDISTLSFHATKLFHTVEGGAIITHDDEVATRIKYMRNFGISAPDHFAGIGINGKTSEVHAAMGLCMLDKVPLLLRERKKMSALYDELFFVLLREGILVKQEVPDTEEYNHAYYPLVFPEEKIMLDVIRDLEAEQIYPRRYFYPSLNSLPFVKYRSCPVSEDISRRVICLPLYSGLAPEDISRIAGIINSRLNP